MYCNGTLEFVVMYNKNKLVWNLYLNVKQVCTFCWKSGSQSKVTSCEITVVLSWRETSGN